MPIIRQNKTGAQIRIENIGELAITLESVRCSKQKLQMVAMRFLVDENGQPLNIYTLVRTEKSFEFLS